MVFKNRIDQGLPDSAFCFLAEFFFLPPVVAGGTLVSDIRGASFLTGAGAATCSTLTSCCWSSTAHEHTAGRDPD